jgi:sugar/nucleoside kinase (ribokinase family)
MTRKLDCIVCGSCVVDILTRPVNLDKPAGHSKLYLVDPITLAGGGITLNSGSVLARLGMRTGIFSYVGQDDWAPVVRRLLQNEKIDDTLLLTHPSSATSTTVVAISPCGERSFFHCVGAPKLLDAKAILDHLDVFRNTRMFLLGYYSLMPALEAELPVVLAKLREAGCQTAMDAAGDGGSMDPLEKILPYLDVYVPSYDEAVHQTNLEDPRQMIDLYRSFGAPGVLGVKLGKQGVILSQERGRYIEVPICKPPGEVVDTTGAGDSFYAGLLAGLLKGLPLEQAGRIGTAAGACSVTAVGGSAGGRDWAFTAKLAGV